MVERMENVLLIVNPRSGVDKNKEYVIENAARLCESSGLQLDIEFTTGPGDAELIAGRWAKKSRGLVLAAGGDGTVREVADGLWKTGVTLGIVPMGSGNGLARSLSVPQVPTEAIKTALKGHTVDIDRGVANGRPFYSAFGVGIDAEVTYRFSQDKRRGRITYIKHTLRQIFSYKPSRFRLNSKDFAIETEALLIAVCNCMQYGNNAYIAPKAIPTDGLLDVTVVHEGNFLTKTLAGIDLFSGTLDRNILVNMFATKGLVIRMEGAQECIIHLDGEPETTSAEIRIECETGGLKVAVPEGSPRFKPVLSPMKSIWEDMMNDIRKNIKTEFGGKGEIY